MSGGKVRRIRRGDIVWAKPTIHNNNWSPALVTSSNNLAISLSFFDNVKSLTSNEKWPEYTDRHLTSRFCRVELDHVPVPPPRKFFLESELLPFDQPPFAFINDAFQSALRLFGRRIISGLQCRCIKGYYEKKKVLNGPGYGFDPIRVLDFVSDAAVLPWFEVEASCVVDAVKVVAQVHAFRHYSSIQQKKVYKETKKLGDNLKQHQCTSLSQKVQLVNRESTALEPKEKHQVISEQGEENMTIGAIRRLNSTVPDLEGFSVQLFQNKLLIIPEAPTTTGKSELCMHSPAFSPFHIWGKNLKLERQNLQRFENILHHGLVDGCFGNCSRMNEAHFSISSDFKTHWINYTSKRKDNVPKLCSRLPEIETTICLNRKRKRLDKHDLCNVFLLTGRDKESEGNAYISKNMRSRISHVKMLEPEESIRKDDQACIHFSETGINFTDEVEKVHLKRSQNFTLHQSNNNKVDASAAKVKFMLGSNSSFYQKRLQRICHGNITPLKSKESVRVKSSSGYCLVESKEDSYHYVASRSIFKSKVGQQSKTHVPFCSKSLHMKFPKNFNLPSKEQLIKKFRVFGSVDSSNTRVSWYCGTAQVAFFEESDAVAAYQYAKRKVWFGEANIRFSLDPFEHKQRRPPLKSCLKKSNSLKQENRKKDYRVRFTIET
ncbi:hypothetical protein L195_g021926 [Trifolium pratense]|uniref:Uncharacterized protein n=1 Tax=Trifolium pratense TaxID=57577 RepID=A0A2K3N6L5_TRIPR|nr:uncharacterized protein LOC123919063 [Trifolium pratense]PNX98672.1 hypothetical protein L195_g021926 [Trifolium pratense]